MPPAARPLSKAAGDGSTVLSIHVEGVPDSYLFESSIASVTCVESLLTPSIHTTVEVQDSIYYAPDNKVKDLNLFKGKTLTFNLYKKDLDKELVVSQTIYRIDNRKLMNMQIETYGMHAIDVDALSNAKNRVAKQWVCQTPNAVVREILGGIGAKNFDIENSVPARNYSATNIHPYQVISEQAEVALTNGIDPSFIHFMTFENTTGTHYFKSLSTMAKAGPAAYYIWNEKGSQEGGFSNPWSIMSFEFPCDFDLLSDILNGVGNSSGIVENLQNGMISQFGSQQRTTGIGAGSTKYALTDMGSSESCDVAVEKYLHLRQARMSLLEQDKIGLRMTVPFNPDLHAGMVVNALFVSKEEATKGQPEYGSGDYLICSLSHSYKAGGFGTTTIDCVSETVASGEL
jgi:hypothetical protein